MKSIITVLCLFGSHAYSQDALLIGGKPAKGGEFPASVYTSIGNSRCSATLVGDRALIIAAHCANDGARAAFSVGANHYSAVCTRANEYRSNNTADWALCFVDRPVTGILFEQVNTDPKILSMGNTKSDLNLLSKKNVSPSAIWLS